MPFYVVSLVRMGIPIMDIQPVVGSYILHEVVVAPGTALVMLSIQPTETARLDHLLRFTAALISTFTILLIIAVRTWSNRGLYEYAIAIAVCGTPPFVIIIISSMHSLYGHKCFGGDPLPSRRKLQRLWLALRLSMLLWGLGPCLNQ